MFDKLITEARELCRRYEQQNDIPPSMLKKTGELANALEKAEKQIPRWIPCEEMMPEEGGNYLVFKKTFYGYHIEIVQYAKDRGLVDEFEMRDLGKGFYSYDSEWGYCCEEDVTHWMPLPKGVEATKIQSDTV